MSITDELRRVAAKTECANGRCEKLYRGDLDHIADRIDEELANYVELPKDADGETIHIADYLHSDENGKDFPCRGFELTLMQGVKWWTVECCYDSYSGTSEYVSAKSCRHAKPDSWERIIEDVRRRTSDYYCNQIPCDFRKMADEMVERCKRLAGEDA